MNARTSTNANLKKSPSRTTSFTTSIVVDQPEGAWSFLIQESLRDRITKGRGPPFTNDA